MSQNHSHQSDVNPLDAADSLNTAIRLSAYSHGAG
jgi:hypothetical protein